MWGAGISGGRVRGLGDGDGPADTGNGGGCRGADRLRVRVLCPDRHMVHNTSGSPRDRTSTTRSTVGRTGPVPPGHGRTSISSPGAAASTSTGPGRSRGPGRYTAWVGSNQTPLTSSSARSPTPCGSTTSPPTPRGTGRCCRNRGGARRWWSLHGGYWVESATGNSFRQPAVVRGRILAVDYRLAQTPWPAQRDDALTRWPTSRARRSSSVSTRTDLRLGARPVVTSRLAWPASAPVRPASPRGGVLPPVDMQLIRRAAGGQRNAVSGPTAALADAVATMLGRPGSCGSRCRSATPPYTATEDDAPP